MTKKTSPDRKDLLDAVVNQKVAVVEIKKITMAPGQLAPKHLHACPVVGYISHGSVRFQVEGGAVRILNEGDAFYEPRDKTILHFDNATEDQPLEFIAFYLKEGDEQNITILTH